MKFSFVLLLLASCLLKKSLASSFVEKFSALGYVETLSTIGEKFWESKDEPQDTNNPLVELNNLKFNVWMQQVLSYEYNEKISENNPEFSNAFLNFQMKIEWIDFIYENLYICATSECLPESTPAKLGYSLLSSDLTAENLVREVSELFLLGPSAILQYFNDHVKNIYLFLINTYL